MNANMNAIDVVRRNADGEHRPSIISQAGAFAKFRPAELKGGAISRLRGLGKELTLRLQRPSGAVGARILDLANKGSGLRPGGSKSLRAGRYMTWPTWPVHERLYIFGLFCS